MDYKDILQKSEQELHESLAEARDKVRSLRFKAAEHQLKAVRDIRNAKKTIARILTILNARVNKE